MSSVVVILVGLAIPLCVSYQGKGTVITAKQQILPNNTAQDVHWRRRIQHAACGLVIASGYKWVIIDALTGLCSSWWLKTHRTELPRD